MLSPPAISASSSSTVSSELSLDPDELEQQLDLVSEFEDSVPSGANTKVVDMGHSDVELRINDTIFKTHTHLLVKFNHIRDLIQRVSSDTTGTRSIQLDLGERGVEDMVNTFEILYASVVSGPFEFEIPVLVSALRIATTYDNPALRAFSLEYLEDVDLAPIHRIRLAREFNLISWEETVYDELCKRDEALTDEEAQFLGTTEFVRIARMREEEKFRKGKEAREREYEEAKASNIAKLKQEATPRHTEKVGQWLEKERDRLERERLEMEKEEMEERIRGYEEALKGYPRRGDEVQDSPREEEENDTVSASKNTNGFGVLRDNISPPKPIVRPVMLESPPDPVLLARRLAMIGLGSESPEPVMDAPNPEESYNNPAEGDTAVFDRPDDSKQNDGGDRD